MLLKAIQRASPWVSCVKKCASTSLFANFNVCVGVIRACEDVSHITIDLCPSFQVSTVNKQVGGDSNEESSPYEMQCASILMESMS